MQDLRALQEEMIARTEAKLQFYEKAATLEDVRLFCIACIALCLTVCSDHVGNTGAQASQVGERREGVQLPILHARVWILLPPPSLQTLRQGMCCCERVSDRNERSDDGCSIEKIRAFVVHNADCVLGGVQ